MDELIGFLGIGVFIFLIFLSVMWILIPFLIAGVNRRLDRLNSNLVKIGKLLKGKQGYKNSDIDLQ